MSDEPNSTVIAIAILTGWLEMAEAGAAGGEITGETVVHALRAYEGVALETLIVGLVTLSGNLLLGLAQESGVPARTILQDYARLVAEWAEG